jgi:hypothetical protein
MTSPSDPPLRPSPAWLWGVTSKDATVNSGGKVQTTATQLLRCQYLYFCTSKASIVLVQQVNWVSFLSFTGASIAFLLGVSICTFVLVKQVK